MSPFRVLLANRCKCASVLSFCKLSEGNSRVKAECPNRLRRVLTP